jgi:hypothetical protein
MYRICKNGDFRIFSNAIPFLLIDSAFLRTTREDDYQKTQTDPKNTLVGAIHYDWFHGYLSVLFWLFQSEANNFSGYFNPKLTIRIVNFLNNFQGKKFNSDPCSGSIRTGAARRDTRLITLIIGFNAWPAVSFNHFLKRKKIHPLANLQKNSFLCTALIANGPVA